MKMSILHVWPMKDVDPLDKTGTYEAVLASHK